MTDPTTSIVEWLHASRSINTVHRQGTLAAQAGVVKKARGVVRGEFLIEDIVFAVLTVTLACACATG